MNREAMRVRAMRVDDLDEVHDIERCSFPLPWPREIFLREMREIETSHLLVVTTFENHAEATESSPARVMAYACWWAVADECHITNLAVSLAHRRRGVGGFLLERILEDAKSKKFVRATLEVRISNAAAIALYEKSGFTAAAMHPCYYTDNGEDALIMWKEKI